jgi:hypothetical protein
MKCSICGDGVHNNVPLHRNNPTGEKAEWRCEKHLDPGIVIDKTVKDITNIIVEDNKQKNIIRVDILERFTIREIRDFQKTLMNVSIADWKIKVAEFRDVYELTDKEAVELAQCILPKFRS